MSANLRAFLAMIRACEGTADEGGYSRIVGGSSFGSWSDHPRIVKSGTFSDGTPWKSSAAGAYQFLANTWDECRSALGLPDFSPANQDEAAVYLIKRRGALHAVENGDLRNAIHLCRQEWASLPGSPYGQPTKSYAECEAIYLAAGGNLLMQAGGATQPAPPPVPVEPAPSSTVKDKIMAAPAIVIAAAQALLPIVADLFRARGSKTAERNAQVLDAVGDAAPVITAIAKGIAGGNEQQAAEAILASKDLQQQFRAAVALQWSELEPFLRFEEESRASARKFASGLMTDGPQWRQIGSGVLIGALSLFIVVGGGVLFWDMMYNPNLDPGQKGLILGALIAAFTTAVGFWFGSSASGRQSGQTVSEIAKGK